MAEKQLAYMWYEEITSMSPYVLLAGHTDTASKLPWQHFIISQRTKQTARLLLPLRSYRQQELSSCWDGRPRQRKVGRKLGAAAAGGAGSRSNTMSTGPRPTSVPPWHPDPSSRLATIHQRYRQDRQTGQRSDSIGRTVLQTVAQKQSLYGLTV